MVIVIIGIVYTLAVSSFQRISKGSSKITLLHLKEYLNSFPHTNSVRLLCLDNCSICDVRVDGKSIKELKDFLDDSVKVYRYEAAYGVIEAQKDVYFDKDGVEKDVCFSYKVDKNGVGDQVLVAFKKNVYDFYNYFGETLVYPSIKEAVISRDDLVREVTR
ncbi:MAG: hypothetical protein R3331_03550 [Sulfurospirillaceae bacterium]|nr:hypothetical protein [Sulfurospirillaceae bacterium]